ncbi:MAG: Mu-like prophage major head subunit gpT family protein [Planctomycetota bacterium]
MGAATVLSLRGVRGMFYRRLEERTQASWVNRLASMFRSDQPAEKYPWLGHSPSMRPWVGERMTTELPGYEIDVVNEKFENGLQFSDRELRQDKTGQVRARINELAEKAAILPQQLVTSLITQNAIGYDKKPMFANDHVIGESGTIDNLLGFNADDPADPTAAEMQKAILSSVQQMMGFTDDTGEPMNDMATGFDIMVPVHFYQATIAALRDEFTAAAVSNTLRSAMGAGLGITMHQNARLKANEFYTFRTDGSLKPFIWQEELMEIQTLGKDSDFYVTNDAHFFGTKRECAAAVGRFEFACKTVLT